MLGDLWSYWLCSFKQVWQKCVFVGSNLKHNLFSIIETDNIDLNALSSKVKDHFQGSSLAQIQFPSTTNLGFNQEILYDPISDYILKGPYPHVKKNCRKKYCHCVFTRCWGGDDESLASARKPFPTNRKIKILSELLPLFRPRPRICHWRFLLQRF